VEIARQSRVAMLGPNCLGVVNPWRRLNASFGGPLPAVGSVAVVSQSGAMAVAVADWARREGLGLSALVSLGNEADRDSAWAVAALAKDGRTRTVLLYLENLRRARAFIAAARRAAHLRLFAVLAGRTAAGAAAATTHTGALATPAALAAAALRDAGVVVTDSLETLFRAGEFSSRAAKDPARVAVVTNAGGAGILAADAVASSSLTLARFTARTRHALRRVLPAELAAKNPLDLRGDAPPGRYGTAVRLLARDPGVDATLALCTPQVVTHPTAVARAIRRAAGRPFLAASFLGGTAVAEARAVLDSARIPQASYPEHAVGALDAVHRSFALRAGLPRTLPRLPKPAKRLRGSVLLGPAAERPLRAAGIPFAKSRTVALGTKRIPRLAYPVVAKLIHPAVLHKTEAKGVVLNLHSPAEVARAVRTLRRQAPDLAGWIQVQEQRFGFEVFIGALQHPVLGPVLSFGSGGTGVERAGDTTFVVLPAGTAHLARLLNQHPVARLLEGFRGSYGSLASLHRVLVNVGKFIARHPEIAQIDLNPVIVDARSAVAVDARIALKP
jgi:acetyltransferase